MATETSILKTIKKMLGIPAEHTDFDQDILVHINSVFADLHQLGVGPNVSFSIEDDTAVWTEFIGAVENIDSVKSYIYLRVRLLFDPPATSFAIESMQKQVDQMAWRLNVELEGVRHPWVET